MSNNTRQTLIPNALVQAHSMQISIDQVEIQSKSKSHCLFESSLNNIVMIQEVLK